MDFMRDGGFNMWLLLASAVATVAWAASKPAAERPVILLGGCLASLVLGFLGISTGLIAVSANYNKFPEPLEALAMGLRELSNNGLFAAALATVQGLGAAVTRGNLKHL
ncbi:MAG: hypothetical protein AB2A00_41640 [Myxococcota bacterium]